MMPPHLRGGGFHVPPEAVLPTLTACGVEVIDSTLLRARCPAEDLHTTPTGPGHCVIFPNDGTPRIFCHHTSCAAHVDAVNRRLWSCSRRLVRSSTMAAHVARQRSAQQAHQHERQALQQRAARMLPTVLEKFHWPLDAIEADSPTPIILPVTQHHRYILDLFDDKDVVWTGQRLNQTGLPWHDVRFRTVNHWLGRMRCPGAFICPSTFVPGIYSRATHNVVTRKFLVVESDKLGRDEVGAVFRMLQKQFGLHLRAVVDTGGRSLHAWFNMPPAALLEGLEATLLGLDCDPAMFRPAQPCRLPGVVREKTGRCQELLYLDLAPVPSSAAGAMLHAFSQLV